LPKRKRFWDLKDQKWRRPTLLGFALDDLGKIIASGATNRLIASRRLKGRPRERQQFLALQPCDSVLEGSHAIDVDYTETAETRSAQCCEHE